MEVRHDGLLFLKLILLVSAESCRSPPHNGLYIFEGQILLLEILEIDLALLAEHFPVDTNTKVCGVGRVGTTLELRLIPSLLADILLIPLFHLVPNIELEHGLVVAEPTILDACNVEARHGEQARNDGAEADKGTKFFWLLNWVETVVVKQCHVGVRGHNSKESDEEKEYGDSSATDRWVNNCC